MNDQSSELITQLQDDLGAAQDEAYDLSIALEAAQRERDEALQANRALQDSIDMLTALVKRLQPGQVPLVPHLRDLYEQVRYDKQPPP